MSNRYLASMLSDEKLINGCAKGDRAAQKALYERYCRKMMVICQRYSKSAEEAEDTLQEGFVKVFNNIHSFRGDSQLSTWITRIMINTALNKQRKKLYLLPLLEIPEEDSHVGEELSLSEFHLAELLKVIQTLPDGCRVVFNMFAIEGYGHKEISEMLQISVGTSKSQYNRAKSLLRERLAALNKLKTVYGEGGV